MDKDNSLPWDFSIGAFHPASVHFTAIDHISCITVDESTTTGYAGVTFLQPVYDHGTETLVGFNLECAAYLRGRWKNPLMPLLLWRAWKLDRDPKRELSVSPEELAGLYRDAFRLMWRHPRTWIVRS